MPKLPTYTADLGGSVISGGRQASVADTNVADFAPVNSAVQKAGNRIVSMMEENEARSFMVKQAEIKAKYAQRLDAAVTSGEDLATIKEQMNAELSTVSEGFQTKHGSDVAAYGIANTNAIFDNQANQIQVARASMQARVDGAKFLNSTGAIVASNPAYLPNAEKDVDAFVGTLTRISPEKRAAMAQDLKQNLNVAAAMANARLDPEGTKAAIEGGQYNMEPQQRRQVINQAEETIRAKRVDANNERIMAKQAAQDLSSGARDEYFKGIIKGGTKMADVINDPRLLPADREHLIMVADAWSKRGGAAERRSDPTVKRDLWMKITSGQVFNSNEILDAVAKGKLNTADGDHLVSLVGNQKDENNRTIGSRLNSQMRIIGDTLSSNPQYKYNPGMVAAIQMEFQNRVYERVSDLRKQGKDPNEVFDRASKNWIGSPTFVQSAIDSARPQQQQADVAGAAAREPMKFPDGVERVWTGIGDRKDPKNWVPVVKESPLVSQIPR